MEDLGNSFSKGTGLMPKPIILTQPSAVAFLFSKILAHWHDVAGTGLLLNRIFLGSFVVSLLVIHSAVFPDVKILFKFACLYFYLPVSKKHGKLITFLRTFMKSRPTKQKLKQRGILRERVFGCDLGEHLLNSGHDGELCPFCSYSNSHSCSRQCLTLMWPCGWAGKHS